ncbi:MAG: DNA polymerase III subunit beta [Clostridia bacterium]|nr:DNA polymerase III subunit beta [Clostridia bacterium]
MKFVSNGILLSDAAVTVSKACSVRTTLPVLECIKISAVNDRVKLTAYDGEISIERTLKADVLEEGEICVNGKFFSDFIGKIQDENIVIAGDETSINIHYGECISTMQTLSASDFPAFGNVESEDYFEIKEKDFKELIAKTVFCCATDDSRPILKGCLLERVGDKLQATALDGFRMAVTARDIQGGNNQLKIVCPARALTEISRMMEGGEENVKIYVNKNTLSVGVKDTLLKSKLYLGEFVRKENIYPVAFETVVSVEKAEIVESIERASILIRGDKNNLVLFEISSKGIVIRANSDIGKVEEFVSCELEGKELNIAMNGKFILEALKATDGEKVKLSFNSAVSPFTVEAEENGESSYLILPVRTNQ